MWKRVRKCNSRQFSEPLRHLWIPQNPSVFQRLEAFVSSGVTSGIVAMASVNGLSMLGSAEH